MDKEIVTQCIQIVDSLMEDENAWPFLKPVDPVADRCPSYFDVIKNPMDLGTVLTKLNDRVYTSFQEFDDDMRLIFSNCLLFNRGSSSRGIRKMAMELRSLYDRLSASVNTEKQFDDEEHEQEVWRQCDRCFKWRHITVVDTSPCRWKCGDSGDGNTCDTPEEHHPLGKVTNDGNSLLSVLNTALIRRENMTKEFTDPVTALEKNEMESDNFYRYLQTCWACYSETKTSVSNVMIQVEQLGIPLLHLYSIVKENKKRWRGILKTLQNMYPLLRDPTLQEQVQMIYQKYVEPFERGWELFQIAAQKGELPTTFDLYSHNERDNRIKNQGIVCSQCQGNVEENEKKQVCALCKAIYCDRCAERTSVKSNDQWICPSCQQVVTPSWGNLLFCIGCGMVIEEVEVETNCWRCCRCSGLFHRRCVKTAVEDPQNWICCDCCNLPENLDSLTGTILIDPTSNLLTCYYSS